MQGFLKFIKINQEVLINTTFAIICLFLFSVFPTHGFLQDLTKSLFFLIFIPFLYIKYILKKNFSDFGFNLKNKKEGFLWGGAALIFSLLIIYLLANFTDLKENYPLSENIKHSFAIFIFYELVIINFLFFIQEYFFKGFVISLLREKFNYSSVLIQAMIYLIPLWIISGSIWQAIPLTILSIAGGIVAYLSRSFIYSYLFGLIFLIITDAYLIYLQK